MTSVETLNLPQLPGIYVMYDNSGKVIYVGKAINLRKRVSSYFNKTITDIKTQTLVKNAADIQFVVTDSEAEAYLLEDSYIKRYSPKFNIRLKDDKRYPYIAVNIEEAYPRPTIQRRVLSGKTKYFGPFPSNKAAHKIIEVINDIFKLRRCKIFSKKNSACLYYHIKKCDAPCVDAINKNEYSDRIKQMLSILSGQAYELIKLTETEMLKLAAAERFEEAAQLRDKLFALKELLNYQKIDSADMENFDVIGYSLLENSGCCQKFIYRLGKMIGNEQYFFDYNSETFDYTELISRIIFQTYNFSMFIPPEIIIQSELENIDDLQKWLTEKRGAKTIITVPQKARKKEFIEFVIKNCVETLGYNKLKIKMNTNKIETLKEILNLNNLPKRIHCFDISNFAGEYAVGAAVCFLFGAPAKQEYRKYRIKTVKQIDDYDMMRELLRRHLKNALEKNNGVNMPELVLIDGGIQHLNAAVGVIRGELKISAEKLEIISLAKEEELVFKENHKTPFKIDKHSPALRLLQFARDEAHRFGITYHQNLYAKNFNVSALDSIKGIGEKRKILLINYFKSLKNISFASEKELCKIDGINKKLANEIINSFKSIDN